MVDQARIEELRRRVQADPASIAFAQLAEDLRRNGAFEESVSTCRAGLATHPTYASARVTLGRALLALNQAADAEVELRQAVASLPESASAKRALGDACRKLGKVDEALGHYRAAKKLAPNDPDLDRLIAELTHAPGNHDADPPAAEDDRAQATLGALEAWMEAIHATRSQPKS
jgi:Flp pilus assembly protein TadD